MSFLSKLRPVMRANKTKDLIPMTIGISKFRLVRFQSSEREKGLTQSQGRGERTDVSTDVRPLGEKIKETTKTVSYTGIIVVGVGVTGIIFYYVFRELFSSNSPNSIYSVALEKCKNVSIRKTNIDNIYIKNTKKLTKNNKAYRTFRSSFYK